MARGLENDNDFSYSGDRPEHQQAGIDTAFGFTVPVTGGVSANTGKDGFENVDKSAKEGQAGAKQGIEGDHKTATDRIREDFG